MSAVQEQIKAVKGDKLQELIPQLVPLVSQINDPYTAYKWIDKFISQTVSRLHDFDEIMALFAAVPSVRSMYHDLEESNASRLLGNRDFFLFAELFFLKAMISAPALGHLSKDMLLEIHREISDIFMQKGSLGNLYGRYLQGSRSFFLDMGMLDEATKYDQMYEEEGKTHESQHCDGCYSFWDLDLDYYLAIGETEKATETLAKIVEKKPMGWCSISVYRSGYITHPELFFLKENGEELKLQERLSNVWDLTKASQEDLFPVHAVFSSEKAAIGQMESQIGPKFKQRKKLPIHAFMFFLNGYLLMNRMEGEVTMSLPIAFPGYRTTDTYQAAELAQTFLKMAEEAALLLDQRNGNSHYQEQISSKR